FQAEDGIRDATVTGVQTCALPISVRQRGDIFGPVDDDEVSVLVEQRRVARVEPPVANRRGGRLRVFVVPDEHTRAPADDLARLGQPDLGVGEGFAYRAELDVPIALDAGDAAGLRLAVHLLEVDPDGAEEEEDLGAAGRPARV